MAYVLSSVSGNLISAASAGYSPTNSGDVSAIASAYQVVSATATQLYAGTAYVTSVNDTPISASRAGNAANASLATSAWYDGTGRLISSLPDSATVSSIASSYAESAVSSKLDSSAASGFYTTANESGFVDSSYVDSAVSSKQDTLTFGYDGENISSIDGSALAGGGGGGIDSATCSAIASSYAESAVSGKADSSALSSYALSADVSGTVDLVSTQSANWGGSALALSAGPGVKLEKVGNTLVASTDETVLWSGSANGNSTLALSESMANFETIKVLYNTWTDNTNTHYFEFDFNKIPATMNYGIISDMSVYTVSPLRLLYVCFSYSASGLAVSSVNYCDASFATQALDKSKVSVYKVVGINRTAEA